MIKYDILLSDFVVYNGNNKMGNTQERRNNMEYEVIFLEEKQIIGLAAHTGNNDPQRAEKIGKLWNCYFGGEREKVLNRRGETTYGLYTGYESGVEGAYDAVVGCEVTGAQALAEGFKRVIIPAGQYAKFTFHGDVEHDVGGFWEEIWKTSLPRKFTCDFEEYPPCADCHNAEVAIYVALADFCQSCGMPMMEDAQRGTNADGTKSAEYCCYCYKDGVFVADCTMEQMIDFCLDMEKDSGMYEDREQAKQAMMGYFPTLKRWQNG